MTNNDLNTSFSTNLDEFEKNCAEIIEKMKKSIEENSGNYFYLSRNKNIIQFGEYDIGSKKVINTIEMISNNDLKNIYYLLKNKFPDDFYDGCQHEEYEGWFLSPVFGGNTLIDIKSDNEYDQNWFDDEIYKERNNLK